MVLKVTSDYLEESSGTAREGKLHETLAVWKRAGSLFRAGLLKASTFFCCFEFELFFLQTGASYTKTKVQSM